jgi:hypothetical protein
MTLPSVFSEENPFNYIKVRQIFFCLFLVYLGLAIQLFAISQATGRDSRNPDPILVILLMDIAFGFTIAWIVRQFKLVHINTKQIIGKLPSHYPWLPIVGIVIARSVFSFGIFRVAYYPLSFIFPSWLENILGDNFLTEASECFSPILYYFLNIINNFMIIPVAESFIFLGIILHRWSAKWGVRPAIIIMCIFYSILSNNFFGGFSFVLMNIMLYIKSRTLIVPIVASIISNAISFILFLLTLSVENSLEQFRSQLGIGIFCVALSTPLLLWILYKKRIRPNEQLPYFANTNG